MKLVSTKPLIIAIVGGCTPIFAVSMLVFQVRIKAALAFRRPVLYCADEQWFPSDAKALGF